MNHLRSNVCCHTSTKNILPNKLKLAWIGHTCAVLHSLSVCTAISRKLVEECIRPRFQAFAPVVHVNGRHYLNVTTQNAQQKEHLKSQFLKEQSLVSILLLQLSLRLISSTHWCCCKMNDPLEHSLTVLQGGKTDGREESCSCYSRLHARHAVRFRPATGSRIHRVLWVLRQLLPWLQGGQPSVALHNQVHGVLHHRLTRGARCRVRCRRLLQDLPLLHLRHGRHRWWQEALVNTAVLLWSFLCSSMNFLSLHLDLPGTTDSSAAAACVDDCTVNWNSYKNKHTWQWLVMVRELPVKNEAWIDCSQLSAIIIQVDHAKFFRLVISVRAVFSPQTFRITDPMFAGAFWK